jgi:SAM-dependent methyltransferase
MEPQAYNELYRLEPYHWWYRGMRQITDQLLEPYLNNARGLMILDAGCGAGGNLSAMSRFGGAFGLDFSPLALSYANVNHHGKLARATIEALPYRNNTFDLVTSFDVMVCYEVENDVSALREISRVTRPGGYVLVRVAALKMLRGPHDQVVHAVRRYTAKELRMKLEAAGLVHLKTVYANSVLMPFIFVIRRLQTLGVSMGSQPKSDVNPTPQTVNNLLSGILHLEARWLGSGHNFPAGVSLFGLATKPNSDGDSYDGNHETKYQRVLSSV